MSTFPISGLAYLIAPYTHVDKRVTEQRMVCFSRVDAKLIKQGFHTVSPLQKHFVLKYEDLPGTWEYWEAYSKLLLGKCDLAIVICLPGWEESTGVQAEIKLAISLGLQVIYLDENGDDTQERREQEDPVGKSTEC